MTIAVVAEKPSVARDLAAVLGAKRQSGGALEGNGYIVLWALGHLVGLAEPDQMNPQWKAWRAETLPMVPESWRLVVHPETYEQFEKIRQVINSAEVERVVCATDAGREGELIFRYIYRMAGCRKPVQRLWVSSLTPEAIRQGFRRLRTAKDFDALAAAAEARSRADWLVGMNLSRAYSIRFGPGLLSVGRVQTPTLAMLVEREKAIQKFVPEPYCEVQADFGKEPEQYRGIWFDPKAPTGPNSPPQERLPGDGQKAEEIRARCEGKAGAVLSVEGVDKSYPPPLLYDLTELQRHANRLYGLQASTTLSLAQALYEKHKLLTYPRTDSRHLSTEVASTLEAIVATIAPAYGSSVFAGSGKTSLTRRFVDDSRVTDHHAIIPTSTSAAGKHLSRDEERIYDLVCRRLLMAWHPEHKTRITTVITEVASKPQNRDQFRSVGTMITQQGWKVLDIDTGSSSQPEEPLLPAGLAPGQSRPVSAIEVLHKQTKPPRRFTDASLLTAMETAGKALDNRELEEAMRARGLGTPATRAAILETLLSRGYIERQGKVLHATARGIELIDVVHEDVKSPSLTGEWEYALKQMEQGQGTLAQFMTGIEQFVRQIVQQVLTGFTPSPRAFSPPPPPDNTPARPTPRPEPTPRAEPAPTPKARVQSLGLESAHVSAQRSDGRSTIGRSALQVERPTAQKPLTFQQAERPVATQLGRMAEQKPLTLQQILQERFGLSAFRPHQEEVCRSLTDGEDALLVMPTGSGKSLCYQLPGLARGGTTLVISPLIALMDDQTNKLRAMGFRAEQIHSGRSRDESRAVCVAYLRGELDFLAIAPERLSVPGFPEMLARRKPCLIAVDEAHCISHWGHDFRPDYRLLSGRLPMLRPAPIVALTATATVRVQDDILAQLGIPDARRFIRGFRRDNLAIEAVESPPSERLAHVRSMLQSPDRRPAIVYVPTRRAADEIAETLQGQYGAMPYHAGLEASERAQTQEAFLAGKVDVIVATVAFGMGVDKPNIRTVIHTALPGSLEAYYQEIGRAGRDGLPARVLLLHSYADRHLHERFLERDYPDPSVLKAVLQAVPPKGISREKLLSKVSFEPEVAEPALIKLWIHGGVLIDADDNVTRGDKDAWLPSYKAIRAHRQAQLDAILDFARTGGCRMVRLIRHFGDTRDNHPCGHCDGCAPQRCIAARYRAPNSQELDHFRRIVEQLGELDGVSTATLHRALFPSENVDRNTFGHWLNALERAGVLSQQDDSFEKDGKLIRFRRLYLSPDFTSSSQLDELEIVLEEERKRTPKAAVVRRRSAPKAAASSKPNGEKNQHAVALASADEPLAQQLRAWRLQLARSRGIPAFRILTDQTLMAIASARPKSSAALLRVRGVGPKLAEQYGEAILRLVRTQ